MAYGLEIKRQCQSILALLSDGLPHPSSELYESSGWIPRATMRRRLDDLRAQGHDVRIVENRRDWNRKARVVEYQLFPAGKPGEDFATKSLQPLPV